MARVVIHRKRRLRLEAVASIIFMIAVLMTIATNLFVRSSNVNLTIRIQDMKNECERYRQENKTLDTNIRNLMNKERVISEANKSGLSQNEANFISIPSAE